MSNPTITMKRNDRRPYIQVQFTDPDGNPLDITTADQVTFTMSPEGIDTSPIVDTAVVVVDPLLGLAEYRWNGGAPDTAGTFYGEFTIHWPGNELETFPRDGMITIIVQPDLLT